MICRIHASIVVRLLAGLPLLAVAAAGLDYPPTPTVDVVDVMHGEKIPDPYRWLEDGEDAKVAEWQAAQNTLTRSQLDQFADLREQMRKRLEQLYFVPTSSPPSRYGERYFFSKREADENHSVVFVREGGLDAPPREVLNPNTFSKDGTVALDWWRPSPDGSLIVYGKSPGGSEESTLYIRDVTTGKDLALEIPHTRACAIAWDPDGGGFLYTRYPEPGTVPEGQEKFGRTVYYHKLGDDAWRNDPVVYELGDLPVQTWVSVGASYDQQWQFLSRSLDWTKNDLFIRKHGAEAFTPVSVGLDGGVGGDVYDDKLYLLTNVDAPRYRVVVCDVADPNLLRGKTLIPEQEGVIEQMAIVGGKLVLRVMENAYSHIRIYDLRGKLEREIDLPTVGTVRMIIGRPEHPDLFFTFESFAFARTTYHYNVETHDREILDKIDVPVDYDLYGTEQVWFTSKDGTRVPMFVVKRKDLKADGQRPTLLYGYGGFSNAQTPFFYRSVFDWLDRGGVFALANIRGGSEFGVDWHKGGRREHKQNTYDDFIAAGEKLIADGWTSKAKLAIRGGSNGGLLVGACLTQRPDLFRAVVCGVPLLDMLRFHKKEIGALWTPEYGDPDDPNEFKWVRAYSPYHHVKPGVAYPAVLFRTAESDTRVDPMHARKMTAIMQARTSSPNPILLWVEPKAGHGAGQPMSKYIKGQLDIWTFLMWQLDMVGDPTS